MAKDIRLADFADLFLNSTPLIDVRAPIEFKAGHLPGAVNLPLLNDDERAAVGTAYKANGQAAAIELGHQLVSGAVKEARIQAWIDHLKNYPHAVFYCFRGGLRSQISRDWVKERGVARPLIEGGYKAGRRFLSERIEKLGNAFSYRVVTGPTGSGKTLLLEDCAEQVPVLHLEKLAHHRGSAFGGFDSPQPTQIDFENAVALELMKLNANRRDKEQTVLVEDESRMIGRRAVPEPIFDRICRDPAIVIEEPVDARVETIFQEYIVRSTNKDKLGDTFRSSIGAITKKLGGANTKEVLELLTMAETASSQGRGLDDHRRWIEKLLICYYDPLYKSGLQRRDPKIIFRGSRIQCREYIRANWNPKAH